GVLLGFWFRLGGERLWLHSALLPPPTPSLSARLRCAHKEGVVSVPFLARPLVEGALPLAHQGFALPGHSVVEAPPQPPHWTLSNKGEWPVVLLRSRYGSLRFGEDD